MFKKILIPLDGSKIAECALPYARLLAEKLDCEVDLLQVTEPAGDEQQVANASEQAVRSPEGYLREIAKTFLHCQAGFKVRHGLIANVITETAAQHRDTLIVMASHGRSGISRLFLGSVAEKVLRSADNPLLLVRASEAAATAQVTFGAVHVPVDGSQVAECTLETAAELARSLQAELVLVSVYEIPSTAYYRADDDVSAAAFIPTRGQLVEAMSREARKYLDAKVKELSTRSERVRGELLEGPAAERIIDLARNTKGSLIAMCTHGRSGLRRWVLGSVTEKVAHHAEVPVLVIRPLASPPSR